jgi:hypothetical protein
MNTKHKNTTRSRSLGIRSPIYSQWSCRITFNRKSPRLRIKGQIPKNMGRFNRILRENAPRPRRLGTRRSPSFDGRWLLSAGNDQTARLWNAGSGEAKASFLGHEHVIECCIIAPPSTYVHLATLAGLKTTTTKQLCRIPSHRFERQEHQDLGLARHVDQDARRTRQLGERIGVPPGRQVSTQCRRR